MVFGAPRWPLGASWGHLGSILGASWGQGLAKRRREDPKRPQHIPQEAPRAFQMAARRGPGGSPSTKKCTQERSKTTSETKMRKSLKMTTLSSENVVFNIPAARKIEENMCKIVLKCV